MFKIIIKTALKTLLIVLVAAVLAFAVASLGFPRSMASFCEKCGNYSMSAAYYSLSFSYTGDIDDLARTVSNNVEAENHANTSSFGDKLISNSNFNGYCEDKSKDLGLDYRQYICGKICIAKYEADGIDSALSCAVEAMRHVEGFPRGNALMQLILKVNTKRDKNGGEKLLTEVEKIVPLEQQTEYYEQSKNILIELIR